MVSPPTVTALVCSYWPKREGNLQECLTDLRTSTRPPDRIVVLDNNIERTLSLPEGVLLLKPSWNTTCRGKFLAALLHVADYYLLLDDDTSVYPTAIERLLQYAYPEICTGYLGVKLDTADQSFHRGGRLWPHDATEVTGVDTFCGCGMFMSFRALCNMVSLEGMVRTSETWPDEGDDVIAGLANESVIVPLAQGDGFKDLGYQEQAMCYSVPEYYEMRDRFTHDVLAAREGWRSN